MEPETRQQLEKSGAVWLKSRDIIKQALREMYEQPRYPGIEPYLDHNAAAIIARLAHADPPLLIVTADEIKD